MTRTTTAAIKALAETTRRQFAEKTRGDGSKYWASADDAPEWVDDMARAAHGGSLPDDHCYAFVAEALDMIADMDDDDDPGDLMMSADIYLDELTTWLGSRSDRYIYCDDAGADKFTGTIELLQMGQCAEKDEVLSAVLSALEDRADAMADESDDESDD